jgi:hypothetical protein
VIDKITGIRGDFEIPAVAAYRYGVKVEAEGYRAFQEDSYVITRSLFPMEILLTPTETLRGRVVDAATGAGIPSAAVQLRREGGAAFSTVVSDDKGAFAFTDLPPRGRFSVEVYHCGYDATGSAQASIPGNEEIVLRMNGARAAGSISGSVFDTTQNAVPGARIELYEPNNGKMSAATATDNQGQFRFARVREGYYLVRCVSEALTDTIANKVTIAVTVDKDSRVDFKLSPALFIRGTVVSPRNEPVVQAQIMYMPVQENADSQAGSSKTEGNRQSRSIQFTTTGGAGEFLISGLQDGLYQVTVTHRDYPSLSNRLRPSNLAQNLVLESGLTLKGTVSDFRGTAVERFNVTMQSMGGRSEKNYSFVTTDGHFEIHGLAKDSYRLSLQTQGRGSYSGSFDLQTATEVYILLDGSSQSGRGDSGDRGARGGRSSSGLTIIKK